MTLHQPWASLLAYGVKTYETRSWKTNYKGPLAIHADREWKYMRDLPEFLEDAGLPAGLADRLLWPRGQLMGLVTLARCSLTGPGFVEAKRLSRQEQALGDFSRGRFAWEMRNPRTLSEPISYPGARLLWPVPADIASRMEALAVAPRLTAVAL